MGGGRGRFFVFATVGFSAGCIGIATYVLRKPVSVDRLPFLTLTEVAENNGVDGKPLWIVYKGLVYNMTNFEHPGGKDNLMMAAGSDAFPFW